MTLLGQIVFVAAWSFVLVAFVALAAAGVLRDKDREAALPANADMYQEEDEE